jgi:hypothetical protein
VVAHLGDVVAQLAKATGRHQTEDATLQDSNPLPSQSPERGQELGLGIIKNQKLSMWGVSAWVKQLFKKINLPITHIFKNL